MKDNESVSEVPPLGLERSGWRRVSLGQIAKVVQELERDPVAAGFNRFLKAEHLDPDSPRVSRWGSLHTETLPPTFHKVFRAGQILYPTRNPHLRRGAVADFDGICGEKTLTIVPATDDVDPRFLPLIFQTEALISHSSSRSVGSTNRHVRWRDVADFEFDLPPFDKQRRIAEVLWAAENELTCREEIAQRADTLISATLQDFLDMCERKVQERNPGYLRLRAESVFDDQPRNGLSPSNAPDAVERYSLSIGCVQNGRVVVEGHKKVAKVDPAQASRFPIRTDDILIVRGNGNKDLVGLAGRVPHGLADFVYPDLLIRVTFDPSIIRVPFAVLQWNHRRTHDRLLMRAKSSNGIWKVNGQDIRALEMLVPPIQEQDQFLDRVSQLDRGREAAVAACHQSRALRRKLTGHLL